MSAKKALIKAAKTVGSQAKLANYLGITKQNISQWVNGAEVPPKHCLSIEEATKGSVKVEELRPDLKWHVVANRGKANP